MPLYIKDGETAALVSDLADKLEMPEPSFDEKLAAFYVRHPLPEPTGEMADKAFFDDLSGEFD